MKYFYLIIITAFSVLQLTSLGQSKCKVLLPDIAKEYVGKCKKGLAHGKGVASGIDKYEGVFKKGFPDGKGIYTWANGDVYDGQWEEGKRHGEGILKYKEEGEIAVMDGIWKEDEYVGPKPIEPKVVRSTSIYKYQFQKLSDEGTTVMVNFYLGGSDNRDLLDFSFHGSSGSLFQSGNGYGYENIVFPFTGKIMYSTLNQTRTSRYYAAFEFVVDEPGRWQVNLYNK